MSVNPCIEMLLYMGVATMHFLLWDVEVPTHCWDFFWTCMLETHWLDMHKNFCREFVIVLGLEWSIWEVLLFQFSLCYWEYCHITGCYCGLSPQSPGIGRLSDYRPIAPVSFVWWTYIWNNCRFGFWRWFLIHLVVTKGKQAIWVYVYCITCWRS